MGDSSLREIVKAFQAGSCEAFAELVGRFQNLATSIAFANTGDLQRSEDVAQQAFLVAWQKQKELKDPDRFAGWIKAIVTNVARNERRLKENREQNAAVELSEHHAPSTSATPQTKASRAEQNELLWNSLNQIPLEYREPLVLFYREDLSVAAVAEQLELSNDVVKQRLSRGRKMLKQEIETMVEEFLVDSKPSGQFTAGVIAVLPSVSAAAKATAIKVATAKAGQATLGSAAIGKAVAGTLPAGALLGITGAVLGSGVGLFGSWIGIKYGIKKATSEEEVKIHKELFLAEALFMVALMASLVAVGQLPALWQTSGVVAVQLAFVGALMMSILRFNRRQAELHKIHGLPEGSVPVSDSTQSNRSQFWGNVGAFAGAIVGAFGWLIVVAIRLQAWWFSGLVVFLVALLLTRSVNFVASHPGMPRSRFLQHTQVLLRDLCIVQCMLMLLLWATGSLAPTQGTIEGYPVWLMMAFLIVLCTGLYFSMGYAAENARQREHSH